MIFKGVFLIPEVFSMTPAALTEQFINQIVTISSDYPIQFPINLIYEIFINLSYVADDLNQRRSGCHQDL